MKVNHVMSNNISSGIYDAIIRYFKKHAKNCEIIVSEKPLDDMDVYHYYRPHLEKELRKNSVVTVHHDLEDTDNWLSLDKFIQRYKEAEKIICLNSNQEKILNRNGLYHTTVIPHGYNEKVFDINCVSKPKNRKKVTFGIISKRYGRKVKGEAYLYELVKNLDNKIIKFILVGEDRIEDAIYLNKWGFETELFEYLPYNSFGKLYDSIDFLLMLSKYEGGPANIPEAIASKTPLISFNIGMVTDFLTEKENGIFLSGNLREDTEAINWAIANRKKLFSGAEKKHENLYTWEQVVHLNEDVYLGLKGVESFLRNVDKAEKLGGV